ncbi:unnamed protein product [Somion occarium]|uniref:Uncharacterized protein n=1 Tax=Somion occarium TaxID=3059160 RepID=A0ABP1E2W5_9APHY
MPHKRAKRSVREKSRSEAGADLAPEKYALSKEEIPKSLSRVLNAAKIQGEWRQKYKRGSEDVGLDGAPPKKKQKKNPVGSADADNMHIKPGESLAHFNRRVETSMRGTVRAAMQTSSAVARKSRKEEEALAKEKKASTKPAAPTKSSKVKCASDDEGDDEKFAPSKSTRPKDFTLLSTSAPRRLNDIVQAPPEFKKLPRGAKAKSTTPSSTRGLKEGVLSMAQKAMMEEERERVITLYREMKKKNLGDT